LERDCTPLVEVLLAQVDYRSLLVVELVQVDCIPLMEAVAQEWLEGSRQ